MFPAFAEWIDRVFMHRGEKVGETIPQAFTRESEIVGSVPKAVGEMANHAAISLGKAIEKVFTPIKWLLFGVSAVLILWAFIGRKS